MSTTDASRESGSNPADPQVHSVVDQQTVAVKVTLLIHVSKEENIWKPAA